MTLPHAYIILLYMSRAYRAAKLDHVLDHAFTIFWFRSLSVRVVAIHQLSDHEKRLLIVTREFFFHFANLGNIIMYNTKN